MKKPEELQEQILDYFLKNKIITEEEDKKIQKEHDLDKVETGLISTGKVKEEDIAKAKASIFNLPHKILSDHKIPSDVLGILPRELAENYQMVVFDKDKDAIKAGLANPANLKAREAADFIARERKLKGELDEL